MTRTATSATAEGHLDYGPVDDRWTELDGGYTVNFTTFREDADMTPILASLPGGHCSCPHWGQVVKGRVVVHYEDHDDVIEAGQAYYMAPGHVPEVEAGSELLMFSPTDELAATEAAIKAAMQPL
jgi:mannose-6-phosphate isomerase-like protein (cupin superfamily)